MAIICDPRTYNSPKDRLNTRPATNPMPKPNAPKEIIEIPRNWAKCDITFPVGTDQQAAHNALRGMGHVIMRNAAKPNSYTVSRDPSIESQSFFRDALKFIQVNHGATVQVHLRERFVESPSPLFADSLSNFSRGFRGRVQQALKIFDRN